MSLFIRLDKKGHWRGTEHRSSIQGQAGECVCEETPCVCGAESSWEEGISCYSLKDKAQALHDLCTYWSEIAMFDEEDFKKFNMQVTIFEGERVDAQGADWEDIAICTKTIAQYDAETLMTKLYDLYFKYRYEKTISRKEYFEELNKIDLKI